ncbi:MAG: putative toxin-antitoxin system toxin component, PIN family [Lentisphaerae bacterium]|nr:putative toxin-antitoxin system toxin component, PIN family [Lentisphaerota bacterium]
MMDAVLDTNVLVSGLINPCGFPGRIVDLLRSGTLRAVVDDRILAEYFDVLRRDAFKRYFTDSAREDILEYLSRNSQYVTSCVVADLPDPGDVPFLEIAMSANVVLVTGNIKHFPAEQTKGCRVLSSAEFVVQFREE